MNCFVMFISKKVLVVLSILLLVINVFSQKEKTEKMTINQLLSGHLASIGSPAARAAVNSMVIIGTAKATFFGRGGGLAEGISVLASKDNKYMVAMKFNNSDYPFEKLGYDGKDLSVGYVKPGVRSVLGGFLLTNESSFQRGIFSGILSTSWELANFDETKARLKYSGTKKIGSVKLHEVEYNSKKGSDLSIKLFFDPVTFRHVRTEYKRIIAARQGASVDSSAGQSETRYSLIEEYSDFHQENNVTLPHTYKVSLEILTGNGTVSYEWLMSLQQFRFNQPIDDEDFKVDQY